MKSKLLGLGLGLTLSTLGVVAVPASAFADSTCYTGCETPMNGTTPVVTTPTPAPAPEPKLANVAGGLPLTGADIEAMAAAGAGALVVGGLMVRRSRRLRRVTA
jgi:LPXTG-motif cell wall-anchored protein